MVKYLTILNSHFSPIYPTFMSTSCSVRVKINRRVKRDLSAFISDTLPIISISNFCLPVEHSFSLFLLIWIRRTGFNSALSEGWIHFSAKLLYSINISSCTSSAFTAFIEFRIITCARVSISFEIFVLADFRVLNALKLLRIVSCHRFVHFLLSFPVVSEEMRAAVAEQLGDESEWVRILCDTY